MYAAGQAYLRAGGLGACITMGVVLPRGGRTGDLKEAGRITRTENIFHGSRQNEGRRHGAPGYGEEGGKEVARTTSWRPRRPACGDSPQAGKCCTKTPGRPMAIHGLSASRLKRRDRASHQTQAFPSLRPEMSIFEGTGIAEIYSETNWTSQVDQCQTGTAQLDFCPAAQAASCCCSQESASNR